MSAAANGAAAEQPADPSQESHRAILLDAARRVITELTAPRGAPLPSDAWARMRASCGALEVRPRDSAEPAPDLAAICRRLPGRYKRIPTRCAPLDAITRGGLQTRRLMIVGGPPGVTKTGWLLAMACDMAERGVETPEGQRPIVVVFAACDEPRDGLLSRVGQMRGEYRTELESEDTHVSGPAWRRVADAVRTMPDLMIFDPREDPQRTVESMLALGVERAAQVGGRLVVIVDSIQTAPFACDAPPAESTREKSPRETIGDRVRTLRRFTVEHDALAIVISELNRGGYRGGAEADLASFKESSDLEYGGDVVLALSRVKTESEEGDERLIVRVRPLKNRLGEHEPFALERTSRCTFEPAELPDESEARAERAEQRAAAQDEKVRAMADAILRALVQHNVGGGQINGQRGLRALVRGTESIKVAAVSLLIAERRIEGGRGKPFAPRHADDESEAG